MSLEFQQLAQQIFEDKSVRFQASNQEALNSLLNPFRLQLDAFKSKVEDIHLKDSQQQALLNHELQHLKILNQQITEEAHQLAVALKGQKKTQGNWGEFYAPNIISHYRAVAQWDSNEQTRHDRNTQYRMALEQSNFGSASFKTRNDQLIMDQANANVPRSDALWANTWFNWDDIAATKAKELQANYPGIYQTIKDRY